MSKKVFVSYSHVDLAFATTIVQLLRGLDAEVFFDKTSILPGQTWKTELQSSIESADAVYVLWCCHSSASKEVAKEYNFAKKLNKRVVPVLMDKTPVKRSLSKFQWIDLSSFVNHAATTPVGEILTDRDPPVYHSEPESAPPDPESAPEDTEDMDIWPNFPGKNYWIRPDGSKKLLYWSEEQIKTIQRISDSIYHDFRSHDSNIED